jgi:hypothetical protein
MKNTARVREMSRLTMKFTAAEVRLIEKAAKMCGWRRGESATFARVLLLGAAAACLPSRKQSRRASAGSYR